MTTIIGTGEVGALHSREELEEMQRLPLQRKIQITTARIIEWYVQEDCDVLKPSDNLVIYGHHMNNGSMFADFEKFKDEDFWRGHKTIAFHTLTEKNEYEILAVFKTVVYTDSPEAFKYYRFTDAQSPEEFDAYIDKCKELSLYDTGVSAEYGDKLITLSTCEYSRTNGRIVVVAKKVTESSGANAPANDGAAEIPS